MLKKIQSYLIGIAIPVLVGLLSAFLTKNGMNVYQNLNRPAVSPPAMIFPVVWTVLYALMGISSTVIYNSEAPVPSKKKALYIYALQLFVNFFWSILFFNQRAFLLSFLWLVLLWGLIILMIVDFFKISKTAAFLQIPYLLWVTFAAYLNLMVVLLNL